MSKKLWIILGIIAAVLVGFLLFRGDGNNTPGGDSNSASSHVRGNADSSVVLTEYADFQCPYCAAYYPVVEQVIEKYQNDVRFEYRHLPLSNHLNAFAASRAAEAAALQSEQAFWDMAGLLFENQESWSTSSNPQAFFEQYAQQLNLDVEKFKQDFASSEVNSRINDDIASFNATGEEMGTPAFFLNGERILLSEGSLEEFSQILDEAIAKAAAEAAAQQKPAESTETAQ